MAKKPGESMNPPTNGGDDKKAAELRGEIEQARGDMSRTVNAIEERLSPAHIKEQIANVTAGVTSDIKQQIASVTAGVSSDIEHKVAELKESVVGGYHEAKDQLREDLGREMRDARHMVSDEITHVRAAVREATVGRVEHMVHDARESVTDAGTTVLDTIKANPIPAALIGVGLGWLIFGGRSNGSRNLGVSNLGHRVQEGASHLVEGAQGVAHGVGESVGQFAHDAGSRVAGAAGGARDAAMHFADDARQRGGLVVRGAGRQIMRAERGVESTLRDNPLALGAVAVAIGAAIGLSLPHTHVEDQWMGEAKERFIHQAEDLAGDAIHKAEAAVGQLTSTATDGTPKALSSSSNALKNGHVDSTKSSGV